MTSVLATANEIVTPQPVGFRVGRAWTLVGVAGRRAAVAAVVALVAAGAWVATALPFAVASTLCLVLLVPAAVVDAVEHRLPNALVAVAAIPVVVAAAISALGQGQAASGALGGAALVGGPLLLAHLVSPDGMGFGDVKAGVVVGAGVGLLGVPSAVLALLLALITAAAWALARHHKSVPLGPGLVVGALGAIVATGAVAGWGG